MALVEWKIDSFIVQKCFLLISISVFVSCTKFGLISPIEVVEEWGCQNSEIRLTCSSLDSTIAILEATFKPNCSALNRTLAGNLTQEDTENCVHFDLMRLTPPNLSAKLDPRTAETIAGRRFLEALRQSHKKEENDLSSSEPTVQTVQAASFASVANAPKDESKKKQMTLRASLEEMLVEYLRGLAPENDKSIDFTRVKRGADSESDVNQTKVQQKDTKSARNEELEKNDGKNGTQEIYCPDRRHRITQLDRNELNDAIKTDPDDEYNIRRLLNYRCSGKNHCSFVFSDDHPFSIIWPNGIVRIKYICMESYRLNKYCGEHLVIVNETPVPEPKYHATTQQRSLSKDENEIELNSDEDNAVDQEGPIAEALVQNEQMFHQLKIYKPSPSELEAERRKAAANADKFDDSPKRKGVFSQDFRAMKILPANLDDFNDIEKIGDEFYFRNEDEKTTDIDNENVATGNDFRSTHTATLPTEPIHGTQFDNRFDSPGILVENAFDNDNNGLRDIRSTLGYDELHDKHRSESRKPMFATVTPIHRSTVNIWENEVLAPNTKVFETTSTDDEDDTSIPIEIESHSRLVEKARNIPTKSDFSVINTNRADQTDDYSDEQYDSLEDYAVEVKGAKYSRKNKVRDHTSFQKTALRMPLLQQGFIASPGYPKYYIGNYNCSWRITAPNEQRIKLIILDVNLRYDSDCRDFLQIEDLGEKRMLFKNCTDMMKPLQILSESNEIKISIKTKSALVYPKRGILIYYSAHGCILPTAPKNGRLVSQNENTLRFLCDPQFVFPDTIESSRTLTCNNRNIWNNSLPNCVEQKTVNQQQDHFVHSLWKDKRIGSKQDQADGIYDILIPSLIILGLLVINAVILVVIWRYRRERKTRDDNDALAQL